MNDEQIPQTRDEGFAQEGIDRKAEPYTGLTKAYLTESITDGDDPHEARKVEEFHIELPEADEDDREGQVDILGAYHADPGEVSADSMPEEWVADEGEGFVPFLVETGDE